MMLCLSVLAIIFYHPVSSAFILANFHQEALLEHNIKRQLHCVGAMVLNSTLTQIAQNYSEYLAKNNLFAHSGASGLGENLWAASASGVIDSVTGTTPTDSWYSEISMYNYNSPGFSASTGHFTQVIWQSSTQLGIGIAWSSDNKSVKVVANYYPAGNFAGIFPANVPPLCSSAIANRLIIVGMGSNMYFLIMIIIFNALFRLFS
ncbi:hypothetical protein I4U23_004530 [Adineta vaga]|nr:hypothetical protein I4U23_004530 [Adineta vaga]